MPAHNLFDPRLGSAVGKADLQGVPGVQCGGITNGAAIRTNGQCVAAGEYRVGIELPETAAQCF